jgi:cytochrome c peroxidase
VLDYQAISAEIESLIQQNPNRGPTMVRLAWHSAGTYDELTQTGGSDGGTIRFEEELFRTANAGLAPIINVLRPVYTAYVGVGLSYADLFTLAGGKQPD